MTSNDVLGIFREIEIGTAPIPFPILDSLPTVFELCHGRPSSVCTCGSKEASTEFPDLFDMPLFLTVLHATRKDV